MISQKLKTTFALSIPIFILHGIEEIYTGFFAVDAWDAFLSQPFAQLSLHGVMFGALFGLVCYATYDLTNLAVAKDWPILVTIVDMAWGAVIASLVSLSTYFLAMKFFV